MVPPNTCSDDDVRDGLIDVLIRSFRFNALANCLPACCNFSLTLSASQSGGPKWGVLLGRLDGRRSSISGANNLPAPFENITVLRQKFNDVGLKTDVDLVALSGAHTFGRVQCLNIADAPNDRLYNFSGTNRPDPTLDAAYRAFLVRRCPTKDGNSSVLNDLDPTTPDRFDKNYYTNLEVNRGILASDQVLKSSALARGTTAPIVDQFARSQDAFFKSFAQSMINMGNIAPITDPSLGEVRCNCRVVNDDS
jgi:peroxidase